MRFNNICMAMFKKEYRPKPPKRDLTPASPSEQARFLEKIRRSILVANAKEFASGLRANPSMRFEELERRVRELSRCLAIEPEARKIESAMESTSSTKVHPAGRKPLVRKPTSAYGKAYEIFEDKGSWKEVWRRLRSDFPTRESQTKVREAYKSFKRRRKGTKPSSSR
jgi:hypothetical protein